MQESFGFASHGMRAWSARLCAWAGDPLPVPRRAPFGQLLKSIISSRTQDAISAAAYNRLTARFPDPGMIGDTSVAQVEEAIAGVTHAPVKATYLTGAIRTIRRGHPDFDLAFLGTLPMTEALAWIERLPGAGRKVAASTLNASTLNRPVLIVDTHVLRVLARLRFVDGRADYRMASEAVTAAMPSWRGDDFLRFHILTKRLGQTICRHAIALCGRCPLAVDCPKGRVLSKRAPSA